MPSGSISDFAYFQAVANKGKSIMKPVKSVEFPSTPKILVLFLSMLWHMPLWAENTTPTQSVQMDTITVKAHRNRDKSGYTQVYSRDISNMYKGK